MSSFSIQPPKYNRTELESMTKLQLLSLANTNNIKGLNDNMLKAEIINSILAVM